MRLLITVILLAAPTFAAALPPGTIQTPPEAVRWQAASPAMPPGTQIAVLEGDPKSSQWFTIRLRVPAGAVVKPHWHPRDERVTVLSGRAGIGFGETVDEKAVTKLGAGSYYVNPANSRHYLVFSEETVLQASGIGPWELHFVEPARTGP